MTSDYKAFYSISSYSKCTVSILYIYLQGNALYKLKKQEKKLAFQFFLEKKNLQGGGHRKTKKKEKDNCPG